MHAYVGLCGRLEPIVLGVGEPEAPLCRPRPPRSSLPQASLARPQVPTAPQPILIGGRSINNGRLVPRKQNSSRASNNVMPHTDNLQL